MSQDFKCAIGLHKYEVYKEKELVNSFNIPIGSVLVSKCCHCGHIKDKNIYINSHYIR